MASWQIYSNDLGRDDDRFDPLINRSWPKSCKRCPKPPKPVDAKTGKLATFFLSTYVHIALSFGDCREQKKRGKTGINLAGDNDDAFQKTKGYFQRTGLSG
jgi:hypothetical protein